MTYYVSSGTFNCINLLSIDIRLYCDYNTNGYWCFIKHPSTLHWCFIKHQYPFVL